MPFNINAFKTNIRDFGYLDNNSFALLVQTPAALSSQFTGGASGAVINKIAQNMSFRTDQVRAPGINLMTSDIARYGVGPTRKTVINAQFQEIYFSILCDKYCEIWQYWYEWARLCFGFNGTPNGQAATLTSKYRNECTSTSIIQIFNHEGEIAQSINMFESFPTSVREVPLSYSDAGLMKINVSMVYSEYTIEKGSLKPHQKRQPTGLNTRLQVDRVNVNT